MISVIISSARPQLLKRAISNIERTIGIPFELLVYKNSNAERGICEIYNKGAKDAKYNTLCYMHEDLDIKTENWGKLVLATFAQYKNLGVLGVAGASYKSYAPSGWGPSAADKRLIFCNYIQGFKHEVRRSVHYKSNIPGHAVADVVCVDGMWFCTPREVALKNPFDQSTFKGFHCYDLDYCIALFGKHRVLVTYDVLMEHASEGNYDKGWLQDTLKLHEKWKHKLPLRVGKIDGKSVFNLEKTAYKQLIKHFVEFGFDRAYMFSILTRHRQEGKLSFYLYVKLIYYVYKFYVKRQSISELSLFKKPLTLAAIGFGAFPKGKRK